MRRIFTVLLLSMTIFIVGCGRDTSVSDPTIENHKDVAVSSEEIVPEAYMVNDDNTIDYQPGLECAAFSSAYLLRHYKEEADGLKLYENFPSKLSQGGVMPNGIVEFFGGRGYAAEFKSDGTVEMIKELVSQGAPVIVFIHLEEPYETTHNTHYIPVIGYDTDYLYFAESLVDYANCKNEENVSYNRKTEIKKFERLWANIDGVWDNPYFVVTAPQ